MLLPLMLCGTNTTWILLFEEQFQRTFNINVGDAIWGAQAAQAQFSSNLVMVVNHQCDFTSRCRW